MFSQLPQPVKNALATLIIALIFRLLPLSFSFVLSLGLWSGIISTAICLLIIYLWHQIRQEDFNTSNPSTIKNSCTTSILILLGGFISWFNIASLGYMIPPRQQYNNLGFLFPLALTVILIEDLLPLVFRKKIRSVTTLDMTFDVIFNLVVRTGPFITLSLLL